MTPGRSGQRGSRNSDPLITWLPEGSHRRTVALDVDDLLAYLAAGLVAAWGVSHAIPTRQVVAGFGPITPDNRLVILQEWLAEAFTMWGVAAAVAVTTAVGGADASTTVWLYRVAAGLLVALAALTALTGARTRVIWFKVCPVLLSCSAALLLVASVV